MILDWTELNIAMTLTTKSTRAGRVAQEVEYVPSKHMRSWIPPVPQKKNKIDLKIAKLGFIKIENVSFRN
jgi:hypothetical protein